MGLLFFGTERGRFEVVWPCKRIRSHGAGRVGSQIGVYQLLSEVEVEFGGVNIFGVCSGRKSCL